MAQLLSTNVSGNLIVTQNTTVSGNLVVSGYNVLNEIFQADNLARVTANSGTAQSAVSLNFVNTATVLVSVTSGGAGVANIEFTSTATGTGSGINNFPVSVNTISTITSNGINFVNTSSVSVTVSQGIGGNANISFTASPAAGVTQVATGLGLTGGPIASTGTISANIASTTVQGVTKLIDSVTSTDAANAATGAAVKTAFDQATTAYGQANAAFSAANTGLNKAQVSANGGSVQSNVGINFNNTASVLVSVGAGTTGNANIAFSAVAGTTSIPGILQLTDSVTSTSTTTAATPNSVKSAYDQATLAYGQANTANSTAVGAYGQANAAFSAANTSGNTVQISANSGGTLSNKSLNFNNTATIRVNLGSGSGSNANLSFDFIGSVTGGSGINNFPVSANSGSTVTANGLNFVNSSSILVSVASGTTGNVNVTLDSTRQFATNITLLGSNNSNAVLNVAEGVRNWAYTGISYDIGAAGGIGSISAMYVKPDGTKMWLLDSGSATDTLVQYTIATPWNIATAAVQTTINVNSLGYDTAPQGFYFSNTGTTLYILGDIKNNVIPVTMGTAWDVGGTLTPTTNFSFSAQTTVPNGWTFSQDGKKFYIVSTTEVCYQYDLATAWDVTTATYSTKSFNFTTYNTTINQLSINKDGTRFYFIGNSGTDSIYEFALTTPYDISTATYVSKLPYWFTVGSTAETTSTAFYVDYDNKTAYVAGSAADTIRQLSILPGLVLEANAVTIPGRTYIQNGVHVEGLLTTETNAYVGGNFTVAGTGTHSLSGTVSATLATSTIGLGGTSSAGGNNPVSMNAGTGSVSVNFFSQPTLAGSTKTMEIGTNGLVGSTTNITVGPASANANVNINANTTTFSNTVNIAGQLTVSGLNIINEISAADNLTRVSANSGSIISNVALNFINTSSVTVSVTPGEAGYANVAFTSAADGVTSVTTGIGLTGGPITSTGTISANIASTTVQGVTKLIDAVNSTDTANAATGAAVKTAFDQATGAYDKANAAHTTAVAAYDQANTALNRVQVSANNDSIQSNVAINFINTSSIIVSVGAGSTGNANVSFSAVAGTTSVPGIVQLTESVTSTSTTTASTPNSVRLAFNQATDAYGQANAATNRTQVSANSVSVKSNVAVNFVNTASIFVSVTDGTTGNANVEFSLNTTALRTIWVPAQSMVARTTAGAASGTTESTTNRVMAKTFDFDTATQEFVQFSIRMPKSWNLGTVSFAPYWTAAGATAGTVAWTLAGMALGDNQAIDTAFGTSQTSSDTWQTADFVHIGPEPATPITIGNTPVAGDIVFFQVSRDVANDTLDRDAKLLGIALFVTVNARDDT